MNEPGATAFHRVEVIGPTMKENVEPEDRRTLLEEGFQTSLALKRRGLRRRSLLAVDTPDARTRSASVVPVLVSERERVQHVALDAPHWHSRDPSAP